MQPDISKIEQHLNTIAAMIRPARALKKCDWFNSYIWAKLRVQNPSFDFKSDLVVPTPQNLETLPSAHEEIEFEVLREKACEEGLAILTELRKCPLLDYNRLAFRVQFYQTTGNDFPITIHFDHTGHGSGTHRIKQVCSDLASEIDALAKVPPEAMKGPMRAFLINEKLGNRHYAPSPEALLFKRNIRGHKTHSISECLDPEEIQNRLEAMPEQDFP